MLSSAGPHGDASSPLNRTVVLAPGAVKSSVWNAHAMSQCQAGVLSNVKSCVPAPALTRKCLSVGVENGSPDIQNVSRYTAPGAVANDCWMLPGTTLVLPGRMSLRHRLRWPESGTQ